MLAINNVSFYFGSRPLYENASLHIKPKDRIGLIGANGTGKSTLLRLIDGEYTQTKEVSPDQKIVRLVSSIRIYYPIKLPKASSQ